MELLRAVSPRPRPALTTVSDNLDTGKQWYVIILLRNDNNVTLNCY